MNFTIAGKEYVEAIGRNPGEEKQHSHLYLVTHGPDPENPKLVVEDYKPMCRRGWNRGDGGGFSIFRGHSGARGLCKVCLKRAKAGLPGVEAKPGSHRTKWI